MLDDQEGRHIRRLLAGGVGLCLAGFVVLVLICTVLTATNFNPLEWLE